MALNNKYAHILYFSTRKEVRDNFRKWIDRCNTNDKYHKFPMFKLCDFDPIYKSYNDKTLRLFINDQSIEVLSSLIIIIDYLPIYFNTNYIKSIRELIVEYPEVKFVFDSITSKEAYCKNEYLNFLEIGSDNKDIEGRIYYDSVEEQELSEKVRFKVVDPSIHSLGLNEKLSNNYEELKLLIDGKNNLFDVSNIRTTIKALFFMDKKGSLNVRMNYGKTQKSRSENLAYCVEEELNQAFFNSYAMYSNGYRVRTITSATELVTVNRRISADNVPKIIIRDYDLQFEDKHEDNDEIFKAFSGNGHQAIHYIRGCHLYGDEKYNEKDVVLIDQSPYWNNLIFQKKMSGSKDGAIPIQTYYISQLTDKSYPKLLPPTKEYLGNLDLNKENKEVTIYGIPKPINGIYDFRKIPKVKETADESIYSEQSRFSIKRSTTEEGNDLGGHSAAPFIYHIAESLIGRAHKYYEAGDYLLAAVLSREALEVLNGFHKSLMWEAIHLHAIAENALIMSQVGCEDRKLAENLELRLSNIKKEVQRISGEKKKDANKNVLLQIFSDIRAFCREREHFECADVALKRMVHEQHKIKTFDYSVYNSDNKIGNKNCCLSNSTNISIATFCVLKYLVIFTALFGTACGLLYYGNIFFKHIGGLILCIATYFTLRALISCIVSIVKYFGHKIISIRFRERLDNCSGLYQRFIKSKEYRTNKKHKKFKEIIKHTAKSVGDKSIGSISKFAIFFVLGVIFFGAIYQLLVTETLLFSRHTSLSVLHLSVVLALLVINYHYYKRIKHWLIKHLEEGLYHLKHFFWPIMCLLILFVSVCTISLFCNNDQNKIILYIFSVLSYISMATIIILFLCKPMYVVYSLVTTRGSLVKFIAMLTVVMGLFSGIYYCGFFHNAGIAYNIDAPQIVYGLFDQNTQKQLNEYRKKYNTSDEDYYKHDDLLELDNTICESVLLKIEGHGHNKLDDGEKRIYKKVTPLFVISNTVETTLEQGATDFFNHVMVDYKKCNRPKKQLFRAIVLFHILISWIFLGVFISMLYQKFRNE